MPKKADLQGTWYCHKVSQTQSDESLAAGLHPDGEREADARQTEFSNAVLELDEAGAYRLQAGDTEHSRGLWRLAKSKLQLTEAAEFVSGYDGLLYSRQAKGVLTVAFRLVPDAHDGLDVLELGFKREPSPPPLVAATALQYVSEGTFDDRRQLEFDELAPEAITEVIRGAWDAWLEGAFAADPAAATYRDQVDFLERGTDPAWVARGTFTQAHALRALTTLDAEGIWLMGSMVRRAIQYLPPAEADAALARAMTPEWLEGFAFDRSLGGCAPESVWQSARFPQPEFDALCRKRFLAPGFTFSNSAVMDSLFSDPQLKASAAPHVHSFQWSQVEAWTRNQAPAVRAAAHQILEALPEDQRKTMEAMTAYSNAQFYAVVFREEPAVLPEVVSRALEVVLKHGRYGGWDATAKEVARASVEQLPEDLRASAAKALWL